MSSFEAGIAIGSALLTLLGYLWWRGTANVLEARQRVRRGALLVDVDSHDVFAKGHLRGSINIPVADVARRQADFGPIDRLIVVYARSGLNSARAAHVLRSIGFHSVLNLGPMRRWS